MLSLLVALLAAPLTDAPLRFRCLSKTYPAVVQGLVQGPGGGLLVQLAGSEAIVWDDGVGSKSPKQTLDAPDLEDTLATPYPLGRLKTAPAPESDPGRARVEAWFRALYGDGPKAVEAALETVHWMPDHGGQPLRFNGRHGAAAADGGLRVGAWVSGADVGLRAGPADLAAGIGVEDGGSGASTHIDRGVGCVIGDHHWTRRGASVSTAASA